MAMVQWGQTGFVVASSLAFAVSFASVVQAQSSAVDVTASGERDTTLTAPTPSFPATAPVPASSAAVVPTAAPAQQTVGSSAPQTPPVAAAAPAAPSDGTTCQPGWVTEVYPRATRVAVWIESATGGTAGVLVASRYVVTHSWFFERGRGPWRVRFADDVIIEAEVVVVDDESRLAVLQLHTPSSTSPLEYADPGEVVSGMPLLLLGQPSKRFGDDGSVRFRAVPSVGYVGPHDDKRMTVGATWGYAGAPLLGCDGRLYGVATHSENGAVIAASTNELRRVLGLVGSDDSIHGSWRWFGSGLTGLAIDAEKDLVVVGLASGASVIGYDRLDVYIEDGLLFPAGAETTSGARFFGDVALGYRWLLGHEPLNYLVTSAGVGFTFDMFARLSQQPVDPSCMGDECDRALIREGDAGVHARGYYLGRLAWLNGRSGVALTLRFSKRQPKVSAHVVVGVVTN